MSERLTLQDLIDLLAQQQKLTKKDAELFLRELIALVSETIELNELVKIKDFGTFKLVKVNARKSVDVNTGDDIEIAAHYKLSFTPDKSLREAINKPFAHFESVSIEEGVNFGDETITEAEDDDPIDDGYDAIVDATNTKVPQAEEEKRESMIGAVMEDISASIEAFEKDTTVSEENRKTLAAITHSQQEYGLTNPTTNKRNEETVDKTTNDIPTEGDLKKESIEESIERILKGKGERTTHKDATNKVEVDVKNEHIPSSAKEETNILQTSNTESILKSNSIEMEDKKNPIEETSNRDNQGTEHEETSEYSSNKKTYIYIGIALLAIILAIVGGRFYFGDKQAVDQEIVSDEISGLINDGDSINDAIVGEDGKSITKDVEKTEAKDYADIGEEVLQSGQTLRLVSLKYYGNKAFWVYIYEANKSKLTNPNKVAIGTRLTIPSLNKFNVDSKDPNEVTKALKMENEIISRTAR